jgi:hypothetical protein
MRPPDRRMVCTVKHNEAINDSVYVEWCWVQQAFEQVRSTVQVKAKRRR